jgi:hypothetical protein
MYEPNKSCSMNNIGWLAGIQQPEMNSEIKARINAKKLY